MTGIQTITNELEAALATVRRLDARITIATRNAYQEPQPVAGFTMTLDADERERLLGVLREAETGVLADLPGYRELGMQTRREMVALAPVLSDAELSRAVALKQLEPNAPQTMSVSAVTAELRTVVLRDDRGGMSVWGEVAQEMLARPEPEGAPRREIEDRDALRKLAAEAEDRLRNRSGDAALKLADQLLDAVSSLDRQINNARHARGDSSSVFTPKSNRRMVAAPQ